MHKDPQEIELIDIATKHRGRYISLVRSKMRMPFDVAESIFQDALLAAWKARHTFRGESFSSFFYSILYRCVIAHYRRERHIEEIQPIDCAFVSPDDVEGRVLDGLLVEQMLSGLRSVERERLVEWAESGWGDRLGAQATSQSARIRRDLRGRQCRAK